jgi:hypothetical protein
MLQKRFFKNFYSSLIDEVKRLCSSKITQIILMLSCLAPFLSIFAKNNTNSLIFLIFPGYTKLSTALLTPTKMGALCGVVFFCILTLYELDKISRERIEEVVYVVVSPIKHHIFQTISLCLTGFIATSLASFLFMPYFLIKMHEVNQLDLYFISFFGIMFTAIVFCILLSSGIYFLTKSVNLSIIAMLFLFLASFSVGTMCSYLYSWVQSPVTGVSNFFGNTQILTALFWNRLFSFGLSFSIFLFGLLGTRSYQKGLLKSAFYNGKKYKLLTISLLFIIFLPVFSFTHEPLSKKISLIDTVNLMANNDFDPFINKNLKTVSTAKMKMMIDTKAQRTSVIFKQDLENQTFSKQTLYILISPGYKIDYINLNHKPIRIKFAEQNSALTRAYAYSLLEVQLPKKRISNLEFSYGGSPKNLSIVKDFTSGVSSRYVSYIKTKFLPQILVNKPNNKIEGEISLDAPLNVVSTGQENKKIAESKDGTFKWSFADDQAEDCYLCAANFGKIQYKTEEGSNIEFFYPYEDKENYITKAEDIKAMFQFFFHQMGPLNQGVRPLKIVITSGVSGVNSFNYSNLVTQSEGILMVNEVTKNKVLNHAQTLQILAASLANFWWQNVNISNQEVPDIIRPKKEIEINQKHSEWTYEALIEFSAYSFIKNRFGKKIADDLFLNNERKGGVESFEWREGAKLVKRGFYQRNPKYLTKMSSLQKWPVTIDVKRAKIHKLAPFEIYKIEESVGAKNFSKKLKNIYQKYHNHPDQTLTFADFLNEMEITIEDGGVVQCLKSFDMN